MESGDVEKINAKSEALMQSSMKIGEALYKAQQESAAQAGAQQTGAEETASAKPDEDVVDADFEEVKK